MPQRQRRAKSPESASTSTAAEPLRIEQRPLGALIPYAKNSRTHSPEQIDQLAASIREFGWTTPILVDGKSGIIAGHGRVLAARQLGMLEVPCIELAHLSDAQRRAYVLADNKLALNAGWDAALLRLELGELKDLGFDLALIGFGELEMADIFADRTHGLTDPDAVPPVPEVPVSRPGDLWLCGRHRLLCGDATSASDVGRLLGGSKPHLMVTDPPYGVEYDLDWRNEAYRAGPMRRTIGAKAIGEVVNDDRGDWRAAWALFSGDVAYVWHGEKQLVSMAAQLAACSLEPRNLIVWAKSILVISRGHYHCQHETCWYAVKTNATAHWRGDHKQSTVWSIDKPLRSETGHSVQKPVECMRRPIENNSRPSEAVYDPFLGSGTTMIAAEMTGRTCLALEIVPAYVDVAVKRWQASTGKEAMLESDGRSFDEVSVSRSVTDLRA
jgi:DNA modification methylase